MGNREMKQKLVSSCVILCGLVQFTYVIYCMLFFHFGLYYHFTVNKDKYKEDFQTC